MATRNLNSEIYVQFTDPDTRENINSGEEIKTIMGKIHKQFEDMNTVAYSGNYSDLSNKPVIDGALNSTSTNAIQNKVVNTALNGKAIGAQQLTNQDLNNIKPEVATFYYAGGSNTCKNNPGGTGKAFGLIAYKSASGYTTQELITQAGDKMYRFYNASTWSAWKTLADNSYIKSLSISGKTITYKLGDGTTGTLTTQDTNTTYSNATTSKAGLMSTTDKSKLDNIDSGAQVNNAKLIGASLSTATTNADTSGNIYSIDNGSYHLNCIEDDTVKSSINIVGTDGVAVTRQSGSENVIISGVYTGGNGITINDGTISNSGVRSITTGSSNGTISVNTNGTSANVAVKGLGSAAYTSSNQYATASHTHSYLPLSGGTVTGTVYLTKSRDISGTTTNDGALVIGPSTSDHMLFDGNEIMVKDSSGNPMTININLDGGNVSLGCSGYNVNCKGTLLAQSASTSTAGLVKVDGTTIKISNGVISGVGINKTGNSFDKTYTVGYDESTATVSGTVGTGSEIFNNTSNTVGTGTYAHAEGYQTTAIGDNSHAEGNSTVATNSGTHAEGYQTTSTGPQSHSEGNRTLASGDQAHAEGYKTKAYGHYAHAEGYQTTAGGMGSHTEGWNCTTSETNSDYGNHLEGYTNTLTSGTGNHLEGYNNTSTSGKGNHIEGYKNIFSDGDGCHVEGSNNSITGDSRTSIHVGGIKCTSAKNYSCVHGIHLKVDNSGGLNGLNVIGQYNDNDLSDSTVKSALFVVGNGTYDGSETNLIDYAEDDMTRSNAMVICSGRSNFYNDTYIISKNAIVDRLSGAGGNKGFYIYLNSTEAVGIYSGGSNCYLGSSSKKFNASYITNMYGTVKGTADYAEYMEWSDGNPNNKDRRGLLVTYDTDVSSDTNELKIKLANNSDDIIGVVSAAPVVLGDAYETEWHGKYQKDIFGAIVYDEVEHEDAEEFDKIEYVPRISKDYDENKKYIGRDKRPEWSPIGLLGKLVCIDDGSCVIGKYVTANNGIATLSNEKTNIRMIQRIDETHIKVLLK